MNIQGKLSVIKRFGRGRNDDDDHRAWNLHHMQKPHIANQLLVCLCVDDNFRLQIIRLLSSCSRQTSTTERRLEISALILPIVELHSDIFQFEISFWDNERVREALNYILMSLFNSHSSRWMSSSQWRKSGLDGLVFVEDSFVSRERVKRQEKGKRGRNQDQEDWMGESHQLDLVCAMNEDE